MTISERYGRDAAIEALLSAARREILLVAVASGALDDDAAAAASVRLREAIDAARALIAALDDSGADRHAHQLDRIANRAQRWLVEPPLPSAMPPRSARRTGRGSVVFADRATLIDLDLDDLDLTWISLRGATLTELSLRRAGCTAADARASRWLRCQLAHGSLAMAVLAGASLERCDLTRANLEGSSWHRATLSSCVLRGATLIDARLDRAVFRDCDLRGADLSIARSPDVASLAGVRFVRCDLRDTRWAGRELGGAMFVECAATGSARAVRPVRPVRGRGIRW